MKAETTKAVVDEAAAENLYSPACAAEVQHTLALCVGALELIPYMVVEEAVRQDCAKEMMRVRCRMRTDSFALDMVEIDVTTVLRAAVVGNNTSMQSIHDANEGFDFRFAILDTDNTYMTGVVEVRQPIRDRIRAARLSRISAK